MAEATKRKNITLNLEKATEWLNMHWNGDWTCPICGNTDWTGHDTPVEVRSFDEGRLSGSGPVIPFLAITCSTCGNTLFFNAILACLVEKPEQQ